MEQFDVFRLPDGALVVDCQADLLHGLSTRLVAPLQPAEDGGRVSARLNPVVCLGDEQWVLKAQFAAAVDVRLLRQPIPSLAEHEHVIKAALDVLISGV